MTSRSDTIPCQSHRAQLLNEGLVFSAAFGQVSHRQQSPLLRGVSVCIAAVQLRRAEWKRGHSEREDERENEREREAERERGGKRLRVGVL